MSSYTVDFVLGLPRFLEAVDCCVIEKRNRLTDENRLMLLSNQQPVLLKKVLGVYVDILHILSISRFSDQKKNHNIGS
jgi:hypothetical protein